MHFQSVRSKSLRAMNQFLILAVSLLVIAPIAIAEDLPIYEPITLEEGTITSVGSDSMGGLMEYWVDAYKVRQAGVEVNIASRGSATAPVALIDGSADIGPMSRPMKKVEVVDFTTRYGFEPTQIKTSISAVAVYVSASNPLNEISIDELDAIYSKDLKRKQAQISEWGSLGVTGELKNSPISIFGRIDDSIPAYCFKQRALIQGEYVDAVSQIASADSLIEAVRLNKNSIGFGEFIEPLPEGVKVLAIKEAKDSQAIEPSLLAMSSTEYPLSRYLNFYFVKEPGKELDTATQDFLNFVLSKQGQKIVEKSGLVPLSKEALIAERAKY